MEFKINEILFYISWIFSGIGVFMLSLFIKKIRKNKKNVAKNKEKELMPDENKAAGSYTQTINNPASNRGKQGIFNTYNQK